MSEDELKLLEKYKEQICRDSCEKVEQCYDCWTSFEEVKAVEHLLAEYNQLLQENQQLKEKSIKNETYLNRFFKINNKSYDGKAVLDLLHQRDEIIEEILNFSFFTLDCPNSLVDDNSITTLCDCENCQEDYKQCWLKYFKNKCKGDSNG